MQYIRIDGVARTLRMEIPRLVGLLLLIGVTAVAFAEQTGDVPRPQVATLHVDKVTPTDSIRLSWSDGTSPFAVVRSETPNFRTSTTGTYVSPRQ